MGLIMEITFRFNLPLNQILKKDSYSLTLQPGSTLQNAIDKFINTLPEHLQTLFCQNDALMPSFLVYIVNQEKIHYPSEHQLKEHDSITVLSPMAGG